MLALEEYANIQERYLLIKTNFNDGKKRSAAIIYQKILSGGKISYLINTTVRKIVVDLVFSQQMAIMFSFGSWVYLVWLRGSGVWKDVGEVDI